MKNLDKKIIEPFIGPRPFNRTLDDQLRFFGRDNDAEEIMSLVCSHKLVLVYAQSGAGKTSIFNAQVIPKLVEQYNFKVLPLARLRVSSSIISDQSSHSLSAYKSEITNIYIFNALEYLKPDINSKFLKKKSLYEFLKEYFPVIKDKKNNDIPQILVFDQLEEMFSIFPENWKEQREDFFNQVTKSLNDINALRIVFIIREDYLAQLEPYRKLLPEKLRPRFRLERLDEESALLAITCPLEKLQSNVIQNYPGDIYGDIKKIIKELMNIQVEYFPGKTYQVRGEYVEPIQLQVVFRRWWERMINSDNKVIKQNKIDVTDVDNALEDFYDESINEVLKKTKTKENEIRKWCEENLITSSDTRSIVHRGIKHTAGIDNYAVDILKNKYLIKENWLSGARWYELSHDRLIKPIKDSNQKWKKEQNKRKKSKIIKITIPAVISVAILLVSFISWYDDQFIIPEVESIPLKNLPYLESVDQNTGLIYVSNPKSDTISVINGKRNDIVKHIEVPDEPTDIAVDSRKNLIYVSHPFKKIISVIQESTGTIEKTIPLNYTPLSLAVNSDTSKLYVTLLNSSMISVIDPNNSLNTNINILVGKNPTGIVVDSTSNKVYVANSRTDTISVINGTTNQVNSTIPVGNGPADIAIDSANNKVYVANRSNNTITVLDEKNYTLLKTIGVGINPSSICIDVNDNKVYVANQGDNTVSVIDGKLDMVVAILDVGNNPTNVNINSKENILYVINNLDNNMRVIKMDADLVDKDLPIEVFSKIPVGTHPSGVAIDYNTDYIYIANTDSDSVSVLNNTTNMKVNEFKVGKKPRDIDIHHKNGMIYVSNSLSDTISVIHREKGPIEDIPTQGKYPIGVAVNQRTNLVYVANTDSDTVSVINGTTNRVNSTIPVGNGPTEIGVDSNNNLAYVTNYHDNTISVINGTTNRVNSTIPVGNGPTDIAVDSNNNLAYVTNYHDNTISVINRTSNLGNINININESNSGNGLISLAVDSMNNKTYVLNFFSGYLSVIDIDRINDDLKQGGFKINSKYVITSLNVGNSPNDISLNSDTKTIYVTNRNENIIKILDFPL